MTEHGIRVPEDVWLSGFDNALESREYDPCFTTVAVDYRSMAREAVLLADDLIQNRPRGKKIYAPARVCYREEHNYSCWKQNELERYRKEYYRQMKDMIDKHTQQSYFSVDMGGCQSYCEMKKIIGDNLNLVGDYEEFYLCLLGETDGGVRYFNKDISAKAKLEMAFRRGADISVQESEFYQKELLPECVCDGALKVYYFSILHNREKCFGYTVLSFRNSVDCLDIFYHDWNLTISLALNDYFIRKQMEKLVKKNEEESITDYLCGMYNRCGMERYIKKNWKNWVWDKKRIIFISVDLDGLKGINDTYGHKEGDWAICAVAESVKAAVEGCCVAARTGGDEFVAVLEEQYECAAEIVQLRIRQMLDEKNRRGQKPYRVDCSVGYYVTDINENSSYDACIRHSDMKMYRMKQQKAARAHQF